MARNIRDGKSGQNVNGKTEKNAPLPDTAKNIMDNFSGKSEAELMAELMKSVTAGKKDGSYSSESLEQFINTVSPMLNGEQKQKLMQIVKKIR